MYIYQRNYEAIVKRGLITKDTNDLDFWFKVCEEKDEVLQALRNKNEANLTEEITDLMNVCSNWLQHKGIDPENALEKCALKNESRIYNDSK